MALNSRRPGFTLMELVVYMGVFLVAGLVIAYMFTLTRRTQETTAASYAVTGQTDTTMQWLRRDLQETALGSIQVQPGDANLRPVLSMASARTVDLTNAGKLLVSEYGVPRWSKHIYYAVKRSSKARVGELVRWEEPFTAAEQDRLPKVAPLPTNVNSQRSRTLLHNVLSPDESVQLGGVGTFKTTPEWGGFRVQFVRRKGGETGAETLSNVNPSKNSAGAADNTRLVEVELQILETGMSVPNFYTVKFRVCPRY